MQCVSIMTWSGLNLPETIPESLPESPPESLPESRPESLPGSSPESEYHEQKSSNLPPRNRRQIIELDPDEQFSGSWTPNSFETSQPIFTTTHATTMISATNSRFNLS